MTLMRKGGRERPAGFGVIAPLAMALSLIVACETPAERKAAENARVEKAAAKEINRVCALPEDQRDAELKKIRDQSGIVLYCGSK